MMKHSDSIVEITKAMSQAQGEFRNALCNKINPYFNSGYADLGTIWDVVRPILVKHGLAIIQSPSTILDEKKVKISTILVHMSGEYFSDELELPGEFLGKDGNMKFNAQTIGIAVTYGRRYALSSILGIAAEEDTDGNDLSDGKVKSEKLRQQKTLPVKAKPEKHKYTDEEIYRKCQDGTVALREKGYIDKAAFDKDMKELESIKDNYDMMETFHKSNVKLYKESEKKAAIPKEEVKQEEKPQEDIL